MRTFTVKVEKEGFVLWKNDGVDRITYIGVFRENGIELYSPDGTLVRDFELPNERGSFERMGLALENWGCNDDTIQFLEDWIEANGVRYH